MIPIKKEREDKNDLIIICGDQRYGVEKALLACHSTVFADMFGTCGESDNAGEITLTESPDTFFSFLKIIYGYLPPKNMAWTFE